jgi:replication factor C small subunit
MNGDFIWVEKYRPDNLKDIILPKKSKKIIKSYIKKGNIPSFLFHTKKPGSGKTTLSKVIPKEIGSDFLFINGSKDGTMDELRGTVDKFASTVGILSGKKVVIIDEADHISNKFSDAMRGVLEAFHKTCSFIFTCNSIEKIIEPIISRTQTISFEFTTKEEIYEAKIKIFKRLEKILKAEKIEYEPDAVIEIINRKFPDIRSMINILQRESQIENKISKTIIDRINNFDVDKIFEYLKSKNWTELRKLFTNNNIFSVDIYKQLFNNIEKYVASNSLANAITIIAEYNYRSSFSIDQEINISSLLVELMALNYK